MISSNSAYFIRRSYSSRLMVTVSPSTLAVLFALSLTVVGSRAQPVISMHTSTSIAASFIPFRFMFRFPHF